MEGKTEDRILRAVVFSIGAALVVTAFVYVFASVVLSAALVLAVGLFGWMYPDAASLALGAFALCAVGFLCMTLARNPTGSHPSGTAEKAQ